MTHADRSRESASSTTDNPLFIVAIGASAGGLEALETFFDNAPPDSGLAFVIVQHLSPDFKSLMDELLSRHTAMAIHRVTDGMEIRPNAIYLIPPKMDMTAREGRLRLAERHASRQLDLPIDVFLRSLAQDAEDRAIAVILSGTGSDGSRGVKEVHEAGGLVIVQSPESARFDGMPRSALAAGVTDLVLPPDAMPEMILQYVHAPLAVRQAAAAGHLIAAQDGDRMARTFALLKRKYGIDFSAYKSATVSRRMVRRMALSQMETLDDYIETLGSSPEELDALYKDLLIGVTAFFRDQDAFRVLETRIIPDIFASSAGQDEVRAWVAGCATGEEAYSVGMLLTEGAERAGFAGKISVFATDLHKDSLDVAAAGVYDVSRLANVSPARASRFFREDGPNRMRVDPELRSLIIFARHNVINDPPFTKIDLATCRNLLIYLQPSAQDRAIGMFHFALKLRGTLFLGSSETVGGFGQEFETLDAKAKIFRKIRESRLPLDFSISNREREARVHPPSHSPFGLDRQILHDYDLLLKKHLPSGFLLNERRELLHVFGEGARILSRLEGRTSRDVLDMVDDDLRLALGAALYRAATDKGSIRFGNVVCRVDGQPRAFDLVVDCLPDERTRTNHFHVAFLPAHGPEERTAKDAPADAESLSISDVARSRLTELEVELQVTRESLQATIEELQTTNEELQATNEEMLAANEELQSTNEELHSVNEELYTVNAEFEKKNKELVDLNEDHDNLLRSTEVGTLFLDKNLRIRKFNPAISRTFKLLPQDAGRPVDHIAYRLDGHAALLDDLRRVLETGETIEKEVRTQDGSCLLRRLLPFRSSRSDKDGVVLTFTDITKVKEAETARQQATFFSELAANVPGVVFQYARRPSEEGRLAFVSQGTRDLLGLSPEEIMADPSMIGGLVHPDDAARIVEGARDALKTKSLLDVEHRIVLPDGRIKWLHTRGTPQISPDGSECWSGVVVDVTRRKIAEESLKKAADFYLDILQRAPAMIWRTGLDGKRNWVNQTWLDFTGRSLEQELGDGWMEGVHPQDQDKCRTVCERALQARRPFKLDCRLRRRDGEYRWITSEGAPLVDLDGRFSGFIGYGFDVTDRMEAAEQMQCAMDMTETANRVKSEFLANMSHEMRTPLNGVLGMLQLLAKTGLSREQAEYVRTSLHSGNNLLNLINEILDLSKIEAGKMTLEESRFELRHLVDLAGKTFLPLAQAKGLRFSWRTDAPPRAEFLADSGRLNQILANVIGNAIKFTEQGEVRVLAEIAPPQEGADPVELLFTIRDTGVGIPREKLESVFDPFTQANGASTRKYPGTGLGLAIAKRLAELMDGEIRLESEEGAGSTVRFSVKARSLGAAPEAQGADNPRRPAKPRRRLSILVVEDDSVNQFITRNMLEKFGHSCVIAASRDEALAALAAGSFDLVLMDVQLSGTDGMTITREIRSTKSLGPKADIPIVALTARAMTGDREKCLEAGMNGYLSKPIDMEELDQVVQSVMDDRDVV